MKGLRRLQVFQRAMQVQCLLQGDGNAGGKEERVRGDRARFTAVGESAVRLLSTAWLFRLAVHSVQAAAQSAEAPPQSRTGWKEAFHRVAYSAIPSYRCTDGAAAPVLSMYESAREPGLDFRSVRLKDWLPFPGSVEWPARSVTLRDPEEADVTVIGYSGSAKSAEPTLDVLQRHAPRRAGGAC